MCGLGLDHEGLGLCYELCHERLIVGGSRIIGGSWAIGGSRAKLSPNIRAGGCFRARFYGFVRGGLVLDPFFLFC